MLEAAFGVPMALKAIEEQEIQNRILDKLFNMEREAENMAYSDVRQERLATLREVIRYVDDIGDSK